MTQAGSISPTGQPVAKLPTSLLFIDGTHVDHRCTEAFNRNDIDYAKFFDKLTAGTTRLGVIYCYAPYSYDDLRTVQKGNLNRLKQLKEVKFYAGRHMERFYSCRKCHHQHRERVEKGTDVAVASHLVEAACLKLADRLILVSGDNDYWPALDVAKRVGAHCWFAYVIGPDENDQRAFQAVANIRTVSKGFVKINDEFMKGCWYAPQTLGKSV